MAETFELYSLTSKLTLDTSQFDRAYAGARPKVSALQGDLKKLETQTKSTGSSLNRDLGQALDAIHPKLGALTTGGVTGLAIAGLGALTAVVTGAAVGVWTLTQRFSDIGSELQDMADQVNFNTQTLGTFAGVGRSVGVDLESLSTSLVKFQKNLASGNEVFKALGVTSKDSEVALRQTIKALSEITDKSLQSALAQEIFGKSGKAMIAIVKATGGDLDASTEKLRKWNVLLSQDAIDIADEFGDKLGEMGLRAQGIGNIFATETAPAFIAGFVAIEAALDSNEIQWKEWGEFVAKVILSAEVSLGGFANVLKNLDWTNFIPGYGIGKVIGDFSAGANKTADIVVPEYNKRVNPTVGVDVGRMPGRRINWSPGGGGGGGGRKGKSDAQREAEREAKELERLMEQRIEFIDRLNLEYKKLDDQVRGVDISTRSYAVAESVLTGILKDASPELIKQAEAIAKNADNKKKQLDLQEQLKTFLKTQDEAVRTAIEGERSHIATTDDFIKSLERQGAVLQTVTIQMMRFNAITLDSKESTKAMLEMIRESADLVPAPGGPVAIPGTIPIGLPEPPPGDPMAQWRVVVEDFSYDITYTIDSAIQRGFEDGMEAGIGEFVRGLLEMARHEALRELQRAILKALGGGETGSGGGDGGGIFGTLIKFGIAALAGLGGGSSGGLGSASAGAIGGKAKGGYASPGSWYWRGEEGPELVKAGPMGDSVLSNSDSLAMAGGTNIYMNVYTPDARSFNRRETMTQLRNRMARELRVAA